MDLFRTLFHKIQEDDTPGAAAELAFRFLFALFPFFLFLAALSGVIADWLGFENPTRSIISSIGTSIPSDASSLLETQLQAVFESQNAGLMSIGAVAALWAASSGTKSAMKGMNRAYDAAESRSFIRKQLVGLGLTLLGTVSFLVAAVVLIVGQVVGQDIAAGLGLGEVGASAVNLARIPLVVLMLAAGVAFFYWAAPNVDIPIRAVLPGAITFVVVWVAATMGFAFYVASFGNYEATYGAIGGVIVLMMWLYITSFVLLLGAEVNAIVRPATQPGPIERDANIEAGSPQRADRVGGDPVTAPPAGSPADRAARDSRDAEGSASGGAAGQRGRSAPQRVKPLSGALGAAVAALVFTRLVRT